MREIINKIFLVSLLLFVVTLSLLILREMNILHFSRPGNLWLPTSIFASLAIVSNTYRKKLKERDKEEAERID